MRNCPFFVTAGLALAVSGILGAAVFPRFTAEELAARSEVILQGSVVRSWPAWDSEHKYIWTHYEVAVSDVIRGGRAATFTVSEPGGSLDGINQRFSGAVSYSRGESAVLFLYKTPIGYWRLAGGPQGKFVVQPDGRIRGGSRLAAYSENSGPPSAGIGLETLDGLSLPEFKNRVRRLAGTHPFTGQR